MRHLRSPSTQPDRPPAPLLTKLVPLLIPLACAPQPLGATHSNLTRAQATPGASVFALECASCHGARGQGTSAPPVMGVGGLPEYPPDSADHSPLFTEPVLLQNQVRARPPGVPSRERFVSARDVYEYVNGHLTTQRGHSLTDEQCWALVNFLLLGHGSFVPSGGVDAHNAASIPIDPHVGRVHEEQNAHLNQPSRRGATQ